MCEILFGNKKGQAVDKSQSHYAKWKKQVLKDHICYNYILWHCQKRQTVVMGLRVERLGKMKL